MAGKCTVCSHVRGSFGPEIVQAGAVKGGVNRGFSFLLLVQGRWSRGLGWVGWVGRVEERRARTKNRLCTYSISVLCSGKRKDLGSIPLRLSFPFKKVVVCGHCLVTLSLTINETLKWLPSLPILMQESCWW